MESRRFDQLITSLSTRLDRRNALSGAAGLTALGLAQSTRGVRAQDATPAIGEAAEESKLAFLFVQLFDQGTWYPKPDEAEVYQLTLTGAAAQTLFFSDRPARIVGTVATAQFLDGLGFTPFNPPNAALVVRTPEGERDVLVIELFNPIYTEDFAIAGGVQVSYEARVLEAYHGDGLAAWATEQEDAELPETFSDISLFIDDCPDLTGCYERGIGGARVGDFPGGRTYGQCWGLIGGCQPDHPNCNGPTLEDLRAQCNQTYAEACARVQGCSPG